LYILRGKKKYHGCLREKREARLRGRKKGTSPEVKGPRFRIAGEKERVGCEEKEKKRTGLSGEEKAALHPELSPPQRRKGTLPRKSRKGTFRLFRKREKKKSLASNAGKGGGGCGKDTQKKGKEGFDMIPPRRVGRIVDLEKGGVHYRAKYHKRENGFFGTGRGKGSIALNDESKGGLSPGKGRVPVDLGNEKREKEKCCSKEGSPRAFWLGGIARLRRGRVL